MPNYDLGFVGYSPLHAIYAFHLLNEKVGQSILVIGLEGFHHDLERYCLLNENIKYEKIISPPYISQLYRIKEKIKQRRQIFWQLENLSFEHFYTCNEMSPESIYVENNNNFKNGYIFDEGFLKGTVVLETDTLRWWMKKLLRDLLNLSKKSRFNNPAYNIMYSNDTDFFENYLKHTNIKILPLGRYLNAIQTIKLKDYYNLEKVIFLITSPLTENGNGRFSNQEVVLLREFIELNPERTFILKPHYRENFEKKYESLFALKNCTLIDQEFLEIPCNNLEFGNSIVVGFHSSALVELVEKKLHSDVCSLSGFVGSSHSTVMIKSLNKKIQILSELKLD